MENIIPLNGRIAIVDDDVNQALPLISVLSRHNIPYVFYKGNDVKYLPDNPENDIRILFLDLNLLGEKIEKEKDIRSVLYSTLRHIISPQNYPYVLVLWSRQENEYGKVLSNLFLNELKDCSPITIENFVKSDFFPNFSQELDKSVDDEKILVELKRIITNLPAYSYIMQWENCVHNSADETIQGVFHDFHSQDNWHNNANCILNMFAKSYLEQHYKDAGAEDKAKASLLFLNDVYHDTLESSVIACAFPKDHDLSENVEVEYKEDIAAKINGSLLLSNQYASSNQPGCVLPIELTKGNEAYFHELFGYCFNKKNLSSKDAKALKKEIYKSLQPCEVVVTPACDYAQKKVKYDRVIHGVIINADFRDNVNSQSDAFYVSPSFEYEKQKRIIVLNNRYLVTCDEFDHYPNPLFRIRDSILAEIQSKLARHISRHGVMNL